MKTKKLAKSQGVTKTYRLVPELVPEPLWGVSAYRKFGKTKPWKEIRQDTLAEAKNKCGACDADGPQLACHDKWEYDDKKCVATLVGFEIRCQTCHNATHVGRALTLGFEQDAFAQLRKVNGCTQREVEQMVAVAMAVWQKRSGKRWTVVVAPELLKRYPRLQEIPLMLTVSSTQC